MKKIILDRYFVIQLIPFYLPNISYLSIEDYKWLSMPHDIQLEGTTNVAFEKTQGPRFSILVVTKLSVFLM